ncbi:MAG: DUF5069 domain-containing protein [Chthoniobacteraceae bacterium]
MLGRGFDGRTCRYLRVTYEDVKTRVLSGWSNEEVLQWCFDNGRPLTQEEILIYNSFMSKRGWRDDETAEFIPEMIKHYGVPDDGTILTDFDLIEMDEGRWSPEQWLWVRIRVLLKLQAITQVAIIAMICNRLGLIGESLIIADSLTEVFSKLIFPNILFIKIFVSNWKTNYEKILFWYGGFDYYWMHLVVEQKRSQFFLRARS